MFENEVYTIEADVDVNLEVLRCKVRSQEE